MASDRITSNLISRSISRSLPTFHCRPNESSHHGKWCFLLALFFLQIARGLMLLTIKIPSNSITFLPNIKDNRTKKCDLWTKSYRLALIIMLAFWYAKHRGMLALHILPGTYYDASLVDMLLLQIGTFSLCTFSYSHLGWEYWLCSLDWRDGVTHSHLSITATLANRGRL